MEKVYDGRCLFKQPGIADTLFHAQIFKHGQRWVVIATYLEENEGNTIVNLCEEIATCICQRFDIDPVRLEWVQHLPYSDGELKRRAKYPEEFKRVSFTSDGNRFSNPQWHDIRREQLEAEINCPVEDVLDRGRRPKGLEMTWLNP